MVVFSSLTDLVNIVHTLAVCMALVRKAVLINKPIFFSIFFLMGVPVVNNTHSSSTIVKKCCNYNYASSIKYQLQLCDSGICNHDYSLGN